MTSNSANLSVAGTIHIDVLHALNEVINSFSVLYKTEKSNINFIRAIIFDHLKLFILFDRMLNLCEKE